MKLIKDKADKRSSVRVEGVRSFQWSPSDNIVSLWIPEHTNNPAKVVLMELPSRNELRQKNLFSVADLRMTWHDQGHFLCVKVDKHSKSKKTLNSVFELFRLRDKEVRTTTPTPLHHLPPTTTFLLLSPPSLPPYHLHHLGADRGHRVLQGHLRRRLCMGAQGLTLRGHPWRDRAEVGRLLLLYGQQVQWQGLSDQDDG